MNDAKALVDRAYKGNFHQPPSKGPKAVPGKNVWIISCYQALDSCRLPAAGTEAAARDLGWKSTVVDGQLNTSVQGDAINQAAGAGADAVALVGIDCSAVQGPLSAAKAKGVAILAVFAFDCDDPSLTNPGPSLIDIAALPPGLPTQRSSAILYGRIKAAYAMVSTSGKAVVVDEVSPTNLPLSYISQGFQKQLATCPGCKIAKTVEFTNDDILNGKLKDGLTVALQQNPNVTTIQVPIDPLFQLSVLSATAGRRDIQLLGGEGLPANIDLIRSGAQTTALAVAHEWGGYASLDMANRLFAGEKIADMPLEGVGFQLVDKDHNLPAAGPYVPLDAEGHQIDFVAAYRKVWGG